jgi:hypothetical protein
VKPSQRIRQIYPEIWEGIDKVPTETSARTAEVLAASVIQYLDEQHELARRRIFLTVALSLIGSGHVNWAQAWLLRAGLKQCGDGLMLPSEIANMVIAEAEREGLL